MWLDCKLISVNSSLFKKLVKSKVADPSWRHLSSYDVITNKNWYQLVKQAQGYLSNVNLFRCALRVRKEGFIKGRFHQPLPPPPCNVVGFELPFASEGCSNVKNSNLGIH